MSQIFPEIQFSKKGECPSCVKRVARAIEKREKTSPKIGNMVRDVEDMYDNRKLFKQDAIIKHR